MSQTEILSVNVRKILLSKAPGKKIPDFIVHYLERVIHQDEVNFILEKFKDLDGIDFLESAVNYLGINLEIHGLDELPEGRYTFAGNHPLGGIDGMSTGLAIYHRFPNQGIKFLSNDILSYIDNLLPLFVPVNKVGSQSQHRSLPERLNEVYNSDVQMVIFPSGICSRRVKGKITELKWTKSFVQKSIGTKRDIVPVYFEGKNSNFFYNLANFRKFLGIKANIEMLYLADEMFRQRGKTFKVFFGKPIPYSTFDDSKTTQGWADWLRDQSLNLKPSSK